MALWGVILGMKFTVFTAWLWGEGTKILLKYICNIQSEIRGQELIKDKPAILASKHQSTWETAMIQNMVFDTAIILKKELLYIPFFGWAVQLAGIISVDRSKGQKLIPQLIKGVMSRLENGRNVMIFPEGTRSQAGKKGRYKRGIAAIYANANRPVYPIALNSGYHWGRRQFLKYPGKIVWQVLPPIEPGLSEDEFMARLEKEIEAGCADLAPDKLDRKN